MRQKKRGRSSISVLDNARDIGTGLSSGSPPRNAIDSRVYSEASQGLMRIIDNAVSRARSRVTTGETTRKQLADAIDNSAKARVNCASWKTRGNRSRLIEARMPLDAIFEYL